MIVKKNFYSDLINLEPFDYFCVIFVEQFGLETIPRFLKEKIGIMSTLDKNHCITLEKRAL